MSLDLDRSLRTVPGIPEQPAADQEDSRLCIVVIFTSVDATSTALKKAGRLAENLGAIIRLVVLQVVPYPLPLTSPPVLLDFQERRFREIAAASRVDIRVQLYLCRDELETVKTVLRPHSLVVMGGRRRWWPTREQKLARQLQSDHEVVFTETE